MPRIFITGSTEGLGRAAAQALLDDGHEVVLHARNPSRAAGIGDVFSPDTARADPRPGIVIAFVFLAVTRRLWSFSRQPTRTPAT